MRLLIDNKKSLKQIRAELKISQVELADILETDQGTISRIERGIVAGPFFKKYIQFLLKKGIDLNSLNLD